MSNEQTSATAESNRYFNEYASGIGYLNSVREFGDTGKPSQVSVQISVIQGSADQIHYEYHDLIVPNDKVRSVILNHREAIDDNDVNAVICFKMVNPRAKAFTYKHGDRAGELGTAIGGILTRVLSLKLNGELVYEDETQREAKQTPRQVANG